MRPYQQLTHAGKIRRWHTLLPQLVGEFGLTCSSLRLRSAREHYLFQLDAADGRYAVRVYLPAARAPAAIDLELQLLQYLAAATPLRVPAPLVARSGALALPVTLPGALAGAYVATLRWLPGRRVRRLGPSHVARMGQFLGQFHAAVTGAGLLPTATASALPQWDWEQVFGPSSVLTAPGPRGPESAEDRLLFARLSQVVQRTMAMLGRGPEVWGLIHGDMHSGNCVFTHNGIGVLDFEDCGPGYFLYDLAVVLDELMARAPEQAALHRAHLLAGYRAQRALSAEEEQLLDLFVALRLAELIRWYLSQGEATNVETGRRILAEGRPFLTAVVRRFGA